MGCQLRLTESDQIMRTNQQLQRYRDDLAHTHDTAIVASIDAVLSGDDSQRDALESVLDDVDSDAAKYD